MKSGIAPARFIFAWAIVGLAGCAATRYEAPPEVIAQPPAITTGEAVAAGLDAELQAATDAAASPPSPAPVSSLAAPASLQTAASRAQRRRPTNLSVEEIRKLNDGVRPPLDFQQRVDQAHDRTYTWMQGAVEATDHRFADKDVELSPVPAAPFRLGVMTETIDRSGGADFNLDVNFDIALSLPNIEKRLRIFVTSDDLDEAPRNGSDGSLRAGLRYGLGNFFDFDIGVRVDVPPVAFASIKWTREVQLGNWDFYPFAKIFAETKESVGYAVATTFDHWSGRHLVRSSTYAKWREDRNRTQWSQTFIYARAHELIVPDRYGSYPRANDIGRGWGLRLLASGEGTSEVTYYEAGVFYARPTANHWLFWSVEPLLNWDRNYDWKADPGIRLGINALFWDLARPAR
ncbi:MAG: hypothetical protein ABIP38_07580 [Steroidobacteraceae bacterium]